MEEEKYTIDEMIKIFTTKAVECRVVYTAFEMQRIVAFLKSLKNKKEN